jgi:hypothetical protein
MRGVPHAHDPYPAVWWDYFIDGIYWGDDEEGVILSLRAKGVSSEEITRALEGVAQSKA